MLDGHTVPDRLAFVLASHTALPFRELTGRADYEQLYLEKTGEAFEFPESVATLHFTKSDGTTAVVSFSTSDTHEDLLQRCRELDSGAAPAPAASGASGPPEASGMGDESPLLSTVMLSAPSTSPPHVPPREASGL